MPPKVAQIRWKCPQCGKSRWFKPHAAKLRKFCSRECQHAAQRVEKPVRAVPPRLSTVDRICRRCSETFATTSKIQVFCSRGCQLAWIHESRVDQTVAARPCESCGKDFRPRPGSAGRFCSRPCTYAGSRGAKSPHWQGGRHITAQGYAKVYAPQHAKADKFGYTLEHRLVMELALGRPLASRETVHHINGQRDDNRPENLQLRVGAHGKGVTNRCMDCGSTRIEATPLA